MYFIDINITQHVLQSALENEKANIMLSFYIWKTWEGQFVGKVGDGGF